MPSALTAQCCFIDDKGVGCDKPAEWDVYDGPTPDDNTQGCSDHLGHLLQGGRTSTVVPFVLSDHDAEVIALAQARRG